jgi:hypothetical protein
MNARGLHIGNMSMVIVAHDDADNEACAHSIGSTKKKEKKKREQLGDLDCWEPLGKVSPFQF